MSSTNAKRRAAKLRRRGELLRELCWRPRRCEIQWDDRCEGEATDAHEPLLRSRGGVVDELADLVLGCRHCHDQAHAFPEEATRRGLMVSGFRKLPETERASVKPLELVQGALNAPDPF